MSRFRWMLPLVLVLGANLSLRVAPAQEPPKPEAPPGQFSGKPRTGGYYGPAGGVGTPGQNVLLIVTNSPLWIKAGGELQNVDFDVMSLFLRPDRLAEATPEPGKYMVGFSPVSTTRGGSVLGWLYVYCREDRPPAETKKVVALAEKLVEQALLQIYNTNMASLHERIRQAEEHLEQARAIAEKGRSELQTLRTQLIRADASPEGMDQQQNTLRQDGLKLRVEMVGLKARREAIVKAIEEAAHKVKATSDAQQPELAELQKIVVNREQAVSRAQQLAKQAAVSLAELRAEELLLSRVRADLADRRRVIAQQAGSEQLGRLNQQLADVQIEMAAAEARVADIEKMLARLQSKEVLDLLGEYGRATQQLEYARAEEKAAFEQLAEAKKTAESTPAPKVVEIRGAGK